MERDVKKSTLVIAALCAMALSQAAETVKGSVYEDSNANGMRDSGEKGIAGVKVSNGKEVVLTDGQGRYSLPLSDHTAIFISKPSGWNTPLSGLNQPQFYWLYSKNGSPKMTFPGLAASGPVPASVDFALNKAPAKSKYDVLLFGDTQPYSIQQIDYFRHEIVAEIMGTKALFGVTLGDVVGDRLNLHPDIARAHAMIGIPWRFVPGNHDRNYDAGAAEYEYDYFRTQYGPTYYSFDEGKAHFVILEDIMGEGKGGYKQGIGATQLDWLKNDLAKTPKDRLVVLMMHIPLLEQVAERKEILEAIAPFRNTVSFGAHWHSQDHGLLGKAEGWPKATPHNSIVAGTTCGCWWGGELDEVGLPMALMSDGTPQGYLVLSVDGTGYKIKYKVSRRPADYQMNITVPDGIKADQIEGQEVVANVFLASAKSKVEMSVDGGQWGEMKRDERPDPNCERIVKLEKDKKLPATGGTIAGADKSPHIWVGKLPKLGSGVHVIRVRSTDVWGQIVGGVRVIRVD